MLSKHNQNEAVLKQQRLGVKHLFFRCKNVNLTLNLLITLWIIDSPDIISSSIQPRKVTLERCFIRILLGQKKVVLLPEIGRVKNFYHSPARIVESVSEYTFLISKKLKRKKKRNKNKQKAKETKKKRISPENRLKK